MAKCKSSNLLVLLECCCAFVSRWCYNVFILKCSIGRFLLFHIHIEQFSVISVRSFILLLLLRRLIPICSRNWYRVPATKPLAPISTALTIMLYPSFSSSFLRSSYLLVLETWLCSSRLSNGIVNSTRMTFEFSFKNRTMSGRRPLLDIMIM